MSADPRADSFERSVSELLALSYIDDLLSLSTPPRALPFIFQRLLHVSSQSLTAAEHVVASLLSIVEPASFPLQPLPRPLIPPVTAAALLYLIIKFADQSVSVEDSLIRGAARLSHSLSVALEAKGSQITDFSQAIASRFFSEGLTGQELPSRESQDSSAMAQSQLALVLREAGPACTASEDVLRTTLVRAGLCSPSHMSPLALSSAISEMLTASAPIVASFERSATPFKGDLFIRVIKEINPMLNAAEVFLHLDNATFSVKDRTALIILTNILKELFGPTQWPMQMLYREWRNKTGQVEWLQQIILNADVFCLADHPHRPVVTTCLKVQPEDANKEMSNWRVLDLTTILLLLHDSARSQVLNIFRGGLGLCPDLVLLALIQMTSPFTDSRIQLMSHCVPMLLGSHTNAVAVLSEGWNAPTLTRKTIHQIIVSAFVNFYMKHPDDQTKLTKILDVAHELKPSGLTELLTVPCFNFTIDLACLASKRDFLKLEKWLEDKQTEGGEKFTLAVMEHLKKRLPMGAPGQIAAPVTMSQEVASTLHSFATKFAGVSPTTRMEYNNLVSQLSRLQMRPGSSAVGPPGPPAAAQPQGRLPGMNFSIPRGPTAPGPPQAPSQPSSLFGGGNQAVGGGIAGGIAGGGGFGGLGSLGPSMSPTAMMRNPGPPQLQSPMGGGPSRPAAGGWGGGGAPGMGGMRNTPGATTPSAGMNLNFQPVMGQVAQAQTDLLFGGGFGHPSDPGSRPGAPGAPGPPGGQSMRGAPQPPPAAAALVPGAEGELLQTHFTEQIQQEANSYFERIYAPTNNLTVDQLLSKMKAFKMSTNKRDVTVLQCIVKNLFEEYRFFKDYPERELKITAEVYGGIIRENIISNLHFATAIRKIIESLQSPDKIPMLWMFGIVALNSCKTRLFAYPKVCQMICSHENFNKFPAPLKVYIESGVNGVLPPQPPPMAGSQGRESPATPTGSAHLGPPSWGSINRPGSASGSSPSVIGSNRGATTGLGLSATNVETLLCATNEAGSTVAAPREEVLDKVSFLFNNLSVSNLVPKRDEIRGLIQEEGEPFLQWLAQYTVMRRVSVEQNFQPLYNQFIGSVDNPILDRLIKEETFRNIKILLRNEKRQAASNYNERQLLKNLGMWLGSITIAKNKPIIITDLDLKSLLLEAYYKGQQELLYVIPFIAKILLSCGKSQLFTPSCAWIRALLKLLAELHNEPDLKINLKFEIEVLCKELNVDLAALPNEGVLKDTERLVKVPQQLSDLKTLTAPTAATAGASPNPSQMSGLGTPPAPGGGGSNRSTPVQEEGAQAAAGGGQQPSGEGAPESVAAPAATAAFHYSDINVVSLEGIFPHITIPASLPLFQLHPQLKQMVKVAIQHAIKELISPVTDRALKVALTVTEAVVKKDFALCNDENQMRKAAHSMMRSMTAAMAAITCRDPLSASLMGYFTQAFATGTRGASSEALTKMIEEAATAVTAENVEVTANFIVKTACEKATSEMEKRLEGELEARRSSRRDSGAKFGDAAVIQAQSAIPEKLRLRPGSVSASQMVVYDEFASKICGFKPSSSDEIPMGELPSLRNASDDVLENFSRALQKEIRVVDQALQAKPSADQMRGQSVNACTEIRNAMFHLSQGPRDPHLFNRLILTAVEQLLFAYTNTYVAGGLAADLEWSRHLRELFLKVCNVVTSQISVPDLSRKITDLIVSSRIEHKFNVYAIEVLVRHRLLTYPIYDTHLASVVDGGSLEAAIFATKLCKLIGGEGTAKINNQAVVKECFPRTFESINKMNQMSSAARDLPGIAAAAMQAAPAAAAGEGSSAIPARTEDTPEMCQKVEVILRDWIALCYTPTCQKEPQQALATMIHLMHEQGVLATDDMITRFFRLCTELCIDVGYRLLKNEPMAINSVVRQRCYYTLDAFVKLTCLMVKHSDGTQHQTKINLLKKVLNIVTTVLHTDHQTKLMKGDFQAMPYHRMIIIMFNELTSPDANLEPIAWQILEAFGQAFFILQPRRTPGFAYAWLDIIGHRNVIARLLGGLGNDSVDIMRTQAMYTQLLICHLKFLAPFLRNLELPKSIQTLYKGTLRVLLVILHDFPELLCDYHYVICDAIPPNCVQLRNLVLSAYPRNMRLPDPFALSFKQVDSIQEMSNDPKMCLNMQTIMSPDLRQHLDQYLQQRTAVEFLQQLPAFLQLSNVPGQKYNSTVVNAVVFYVGIRAIEDLRSRNLRVSVQNIAHCSYMDIFQNLAVQLCTEGRYILFNAIANQLRYPNVQTHYFSCVFLFLFLNSDSPAIQEQITRILFERLVALRPHPWGLLITFIELINNPAYNFWKNDFTRCAPEIERLFQNVASTCQVKNPGAGIDAAQLPS